MFEQCRRQGGAAPENQVPANLRLDAANILDDVRSKSHERSPCKTFRTVCDDIQYAGIGEAIAGAIREIVLTGTLGKLEKLRAQAPPVLASITNYPRLDPKRVARVYKKFKIGSVEELRASLESGDIEKALGNSIEEMAAAARDRGYEYIGITDHSQSLKIARGLSSEELWAQIRYIDRLNTNCLLYTSDAADDLLCVD